MCVAKRGRYVRKTGEKIEERKMSERLSRIGRTLTCKGKGFCHRVLIKYVGQSILCDFFLPSSGVPRGLFEVVEGPNSRLRQCCSLYSTVVVN